MTVLDNFRVGSKRKRLMPDNRLPKDQTFNVEELGLDIAEQMHRVLQPGDLGEVVTQVEVFASRSEPVTTLLPMVTLPAYVKHNTNVDELGKLSAAAVVQQYEAAAVKIELMGKELIDAAQRAEQMTLEVKEAIKQVEEVAQKYRDEAKIIFLRIEQASLLTTEVRTTCDDMRKKIESQTVLPS